MATYKSEYYRFNGATWDLFYFKTSADLIVETATYKVLTADERNKISMYLSTFNVANKLALVESNGKLPVAVIPDLAYLPLTGGTVSGSITAFGFHASMQVYTPDAYIGTILPYVQDGAVEFDERTGYIDFNEVPLRNVPNPTNQKDAVNKEYVDNLVSAGFKVRNPVKVASTQNINLSQAVSTIDGYSTGEGDRILLRSQTNASENGVYEKRPDGKLQKLASDSSLGVAVFVEHGDTYNDYIFVHAYQNEWIIFTKPDTIKAGSGLTKSGTTLSIATSGVATSMIADGAVTSTKIANLAADDIAEDWSTVQAASSAYSITNKLSHLYRAIKLLRGTANFNTSNSQTIAGAYALANAKIKSEIGTTVPGTSGYTTGDLFFKTL